MRTPLQQFEDRLKTIGLNDEQVTDVVAAVREWIEAIFRRKPV